MIKQITFKKYNVYKSYKTINEINTNLAYYFVLYMSMAYCEPQLVKMFIDKASPVQMAQENNI